ncbi:MAG: osmotically inducible protein C [Acidobacteria bacterium]|nr:osmotically inducible protein C [Acidobacteriota bacterium]
MDNEMIVSFPGGKKVTARYNGFHILTDQDPDAGGEGSAPEPFALFLASLATCAGIYVLSFCQRRGIPHEGVRLVQRWTWEPDHRLGRVELDIRVPDDFPAKYHAALERAAAMCAVKRTLENPPELVVRTVAADVPVTPGTQRTGISLPTR